MQCKVSLCLKVFKLQFFIESLYKKLDIYANFFQQKVKLSGKGMAWERRREGEGGPFCGDGNSISEGGGKRRKKEEEGWKKPFLFPHASMPAGKERRMEDGRGPLYPPRPQSPKPFFL